MHSISIIEGSEFLKQGKVIAYPTEAVFGFGCCPHNEKALEYLLKIKQRSPKKGLIVIASEVHQLLPLLDLSVISSQRWKEILKVWPGAYTFVFPASDKVHSLVRGEHASVAVRVTAHPIASQLCETFGGAIVSTSANEASLPPFKNAHEIYHHFGEKIAGIVCGEVGNALSVTPIHDAITGHIYR